VHRISFFLLMSLAGCGGSVSAECPQQGSTTVQVSLPTQPSATLVIRGDCTPFSCKKQSASGCSLWEGTIATAPGSACSFTLISAQHETLDSAVLEGESTCGKKTASLTLGGGSDAGALR
jgi:hypothetical protein